MAARLPSASGAGRYVRVLAVVTGTAAQFVVSYVSLYRPYSKLRRDHRVQLMGVLFEGLRREYRGKREPTPTCG